MSIPRNHHYVSQVLSRRFMSSSGKIYVYNKSTNRISTLNSTKKLFSERDLNSKVDDNDNIDHGSVEESLNQNFETDFNHNCDVVIQAANANNPIGKVIPNSAEVNTSVEYLIGMALIGNARHPSKISEISSVVNDALLSIAAFNFPESADKINSMKSDVSGETIKRLVDFNKLSKGARKEMGEINASIMVADERSYFLLPDCSSASKRFKLEDDFEIDGRILTSPARPIGLVMMPINSKVMIAACAAKLSPFKENGIYHISSELVQKYNRSFYDSAYEGVVCENEDYLEAFLSSLTAHSAS